MPLILLLMLFLLPLVRTLALVDSLPLCTWSYIDSLHFKNTPGGRDLTDLAFTGHFFTVPKRRISNTTVSCSHATDWVTLRNVQRRCRHYCAALTLASPPPVLKIPPPMDRRAASYVKDRLVYEEFQQEPPPSLEPKDPFQRQVRVSHMHAVVPYNISILRISIGIRTSKYGILLMGLRCFYVHIYDVVWFLMFFFVPASFFLYEEKHLFRG